MMIKRMMSFLISIVLMNGLYNIQCANATEKYNPSIETVKAIEPDITGSFDTEIPYIVDNKSETNAKQQSQDLTALAISLGADTDHFNFPNYVVTEGDDKIAEMLGQAGVSYRGPLNGVCYGMSVLQILTHNGVISPSDIQEGAETLDQISFNSDINGILVYYSFMQLFDLQQYALFEYYCSHSREEIINDLITYSENAMRENKYFMINIKVEAQNDNLVAGHAIVGIGIADGNWTYDNMEFDKCILTLDSNCVDENDKTIGVGFKEKAFIYINSKTNEFYFPAYECGSNDEFVNITYVGNDMDLFNYKGYINPSNSYDSRYENIKRIQIDNFRETEYNLTVSTNDEIEEYHGYPYKGCEGFTENYLTRLTGKYHFEHYREADAVTIETTSTSYDDGGFGLLISDLGKWGVNVTNTSKSLSRLHVEEKKGIFTHLDKDLEKGKFYMIIGNSDYAYMPYHNISIEAFTAGEVSMQLTDQGVLICTDKGFNGFMDLYRSDLSSDDPNQILTINMSSNNNIMLKYDEFNDKIYFTTGENFDNIVKKGDVNCDGDINAVDASLVLAGYANVQAGNVWSYVNEDLGDYNSDGNVDASDASLILEYYANTQTGK